MNPSSCHPDEHHYAKGLCYRCYRRQYHAGSEEQRAKRAARSRAWRAKYPEYGKRMLKKWTAGNYGRKASGNRWYHIALKYGLSETGYVDMVKEQCGACRLCGHVPHYALHVDHDHATGRIRGLLCAGCNTMLGKLERLGPDALTRVAAYLTKED